MPRKRELVYIPDNNDRKASFKKRKKGLLKKVREITVLCGVEACAIIGPYEELEPEAWPSTDGVRQSVARLKDMPAPQQTRRKYSQEKITKERIDKVCIKLEKVAMDTREKEMTEVMFQCLGGNHRESMKPMSITDLNDLASMTNKHLKEVTEKFEALVKQNSSLVMSTAPAPTHHHVLIADMNGGVSDFVAPAMAAMQNDEGNYGDMLTPMLLPNSHPSMACNTSWLPNVNSSHP